MGFAGAELAGIRDAGLYRSLRRGRVDGAHVMVGGERLLNLCSNDYLGIPPTEVPAGQFQSSSRLVSGSDECHYRLEDMLAGRRSHEAGLLYPTGYMANLGVIQAVAGEGDLIVSDRLNHASIIEACRLSGARVSVYDHNDVDDLGRRLRDEASRKFVVTEGIFSMDGDYSPLAEICEVSEKAGAVTILDDAHGDFVSGRNGRGTPSRARVARRIDICVSSLSKALGSFGGYVTSSRDVVDLCINRSGAFIYTSALPHPLAEHAMCRMVMDHGWRRRRLEENRRMLAAGLKRIGFDIESGTHIIPIVLGDERTAMRFGEDLYGRGVFAQPIRFPTVPRGAARLRISVTAWMRHEDIRFALDAFEGSYHAMMDGAGSR